MGLSSELPIPLCTLLCDVRIAPGPVSWGVVIQGASQDRGGALGAPSVLSGLGGH